MVMTEHNPKRHYAPRESARGPVGQKEGAIMKTNGREGAAGVGEIMVLSAAAGAGHVSAAEALVGACHAKGISARHIEVLKYTNAVYRKAYSDLYLELVNRRPELLGWIYNALDKPWKYEKRRLALDMMNTGPFLRLMTKQPPRIVLCTHFLPAELILHLKKKHRLDMPLGVIVTDYDAHAMWLYRNVDWYFVACEETKVYLAEVGIPEGSIHVTGIPIKPSFAAPLSREEERKTLGLEDGRTTILMTAGGFGVGPVEGLVDGLEKLRHPVQIVVICGKNSGLKERLESRSGDPHPLKVVGYTTEMHRWMAASDLLVGKVGGLTSAEALASGLMMVIVNPVPGQEERNSDHFLEEGAAIRCNNLPALAYKIDRLLDDEERVRRMQASVRRMARPQAAFDIVSIATGQGC